MMPFESDDHVTILELETIDQLDALKPAWLQLHGHHRQIVDPGLLVADDDDSWSARRRDYSAWLAAGDLLILVAQRAGRAIGYVAARLVNGPDDTFAVHERYAEIYSLLVLDQERGRGVGSRLMDEVDLRLAAQGIHDMSVAVFSDNIEALNFYRRRGLVPLETVLWRISTDPP